MRDGRFHLNHFYEVLARIAHNEPERFKRTSPRLRYALSVYLMLKRLALKERRGLTAPLVL